MFSVVDKNIPQAAKDLTLKFCQSTNETTSMQLDEDDRGFSYSRDTDLDMRMDPTTGPTAADVLNTRPLAEVLRWLGLDWDEGPFLQSHRFGACLEAADGLLAAGLAYE